MTRPQLSIQLRRDPGNVVGDRLYFAGKSAPAYEKTASNRLLANIGGTQYDIAEAIKRSYWMFGVRFERR